ncbi:asparagine synthase-related protein [Streptomyces sp. NPDC046870]|uniref:asparagine synthase-related protein n=1 Tax=Streptomyces sp. NPDC046870 TaxID=3155135 RepID=UPI003451D28B
MEALRVEFAGGAPRLRAAEAMVRRGLVTTVSSPAGTAAVVGWTGSVRDRLAGARALLGAFARPGCEPPLPIGDFAAVLVYRDRVLLMRDGQARIPLFFRRSGDRVSAVSTSARGLGDAAELEPCYFCRYLTGNMAQPHTELSPFTGVHRILGGEVVELSVTGRMRGRRPGRTAGAGDEPPAAVTDADTAGRQLRRALEHAVGRRLGRTVACHVSGGTDSTSVALLAARLLAEGQQGGTGELILLAGRFGGGELAGERPYLEEAVEAVRGLAPGARPVIVDADDVADFDDFAHHAMASDEPHAHAFRAPFWSRLHAAAAELGCDTVLTGCGADPVVDANPFHLHRLARSGRLREMTSLARARAASSEQGVRDIVRTHVVRPALPLTAERVTRLAHRGTVLGGLGHFTRPPWLRRGFARAHGYRAAGLAESRFLFGTTPERSLYDAANYLAAPDPLSWRCAPRDGFFLSHPFLDPEVIATMRRLPAEATFRPGRPKAVLRDAMADMLPPRIRDRTDKIPFNDPYVHGLRAHGDDLVGLCRSARHPLVTEMFDIDTLCQAVREARLGLGDSASWDRVNGSLALVVWLEGLLDGSSPAPGATMPVSVVS